MYHNKKYGDIPISMFISILIYYNIVYLLFGTEGGGILPMVTHISDTVKIPRCVCIVNGYIG